jgi:hypothetical protein
LNRIIDGNYYPVPEVISQSSLSSLNLISIYIS